MDLTQLASSQAPNAIALASAALLAFIGFRALGSRKGLKFTFVSLAMMSVCVVLIKNLMYWLIMADQGENSRTAWLGYAGALLFVWVAQLILAAFMLIASIVATNRYAWVAIFASLAHVWAAICMLSWYNAYQAGDASKPVQFEPWSPGFHWVILAFMVVALVMAMVSLARRPKTKKK